MCPIFALLELLVCWVIPLGRPQSASSPHRWHTRDTDRETWNTTSYACRFRVESNGQESGFIGVAPGMIVCLFSIVYISQCPDLL